MYIYMYVDCYGKTNLLSSKENTSFEMSNFWQN